MRLIVYIVPQVCDSTHLGPSEVFLRRSKLVFCRFLDLHFKVLYRIYGKIWKMESCLRGESKTTILKGKKLFFMKGKQRGKTTKVRGQGGRRGVIWTIHVDILCSQERYILFFGNLSLTPLLTKFLATPLCINISIRMVRQFLIIQFYPIVLDH